VLGLFLVADADRLGLDLTDYDGGGLRMINPLTGERATLGDVLAPHVADAAGRILPMQPLSALGADDGTNYLNPAAGLHALGLASSVLRGTNTRLVGFEAGAATATDRDGDFNDAAVAVGRAPLGAGVLRLLGKEAAGARLGTADADHLRGTAGADHIDGRGGNDLIDGRGGDDLLHGGSGDDDFRFVRSGFGADSIYDFDRGSGDRIVLGGMADGFAALDSTGDGRLTAADAAVGRSDGALTLDLGGGDRIAVAGVSALAADDLIFL
jgi:Ca2+-binding RTX toxin-like protein